MADTPTGPLLASEVLARAAMRWDDLLDEEQDLFGPDAVPPLGDLQSAALLACFPDAPYGVTIRPDGTMEAAMPPMEKVKTLGDVLGYDSDGNLGEPPALYSARPLPSAPEGDTDR